MKAIDLAQVPLTLKETEMIDDKGLHYHNWTYYGPLPSIGPDTFITVNILLYPFFFFIIPLFFKNYYHFLSRFILIFYYYYFWLMNMYYNSTTVNFANTSVALDAQTTKYTLSIRGWNFRSMRNSLGVVFSTNSTDDEMCVRSQQDGSGSVQWVKVILPNGHALYPSLFLSFSSFSSFRFVVVYYFDYWKVCNVYARSSVGQNEYLRKAPHARARQGRTTSAPFLGRIRVRSELQSTRNRFGN